MYGSEEGNHSLGRSVNFLLLILPSPDSITLFFLDDLDEQSLSPSTREYMYRGPHNGNSHELSFSSSKSASSKAPSDSYDHDEPEPIDGQQSSSSSFPHDDSDILKGFREAPDSSLLRQGVDAVYSAIGSDSSVPLDKIVDALRHSNYDVDESLSILLQSPSAFNSNQNRQNSKEPSRPSPPGPVIPKVNGSSQPKILELGTNHNSSTPSITVNHFTSAKPEISKGIPQDSGSSSSTLIPPVPTHAARISSMDSILSSGKTVRQRSAAASAELRSLVEQAATGEKPHVALVVIGHVDAGKSTIMGHILYLLGNVDEKTMRRFRKESSDIGKGSFAFAWVLDQSEEERNRGVTIEVAHSHFELPNRRITLLDAPGHRDFIPNMIAGAQQADVAMLVVNASPDEFETGLQNQTKEHVLLAKALGVIFLLVAVNKLDICEWAQARFDEVCTQLKTLLRTVGFKEADYIMVPCSGLSGENLLTRKEPLLSSWWTGPTLVEEMNRFPIPARLVEKPLRLSAQEVSRSSSAASITLSGRLESGTLIGGDRLLVLPGNEIATLRG